MKERKKTEKTAASASTEVPETLETGKSIVLADEKPASIAITEEKAGKGLAAAVAKAVSRRRDEHCDDADDDYGYSEKDFFLTEKDFPSRGKLVLYAFFAYLALVAVLAVSVPLITKLFWTVFIVLLGGAVYGFIFFSLVSMITGLSQKGFEARSRAVLDTLSKNGDLSFGQILVLTPRIKNEQDLVKLLVKMFRKGLLPGYRIRLGKKLLERIEPDFD